MENTQNDNIERGLLSAIIFEDGEAQEELLLKLQRQDFANTLHQHLFGVMASLHGQEKPVTEEFIQPYVEDSLLLEVMSAKPIPTPVKFINELRVLRKKREWGMALAKASQMETDEAMEYLTQVKEDTAVYEAPLFELVPLSKAVAIDTEWIGTNWLPIPKRAVTLLTAQGGTGKSFVALQALIRYLHEHPGQKAFAWLSEDPIGVTLTRAKAICADQVIPLAVLDRLMAIGSETEVKHFYNSDGATPVFGQVKQLLKDYGLILVDPLIAFYGEDENNNSHARAFMNSFTAWVNKEDKAVIMIHHSKKGDSDQGARGAGAFVDAARLTYSLNKTLTFGTGDNKVVEKPGDNKLFITVGKDNYNAKQFLGGDATFKRKIFPFELEIDPPSNGDNSPTKKEDKKDETWNKLMQ